LYVLSGVLLFSATFALIALWIGVIRSLPAGCLADDPTRRDFLLARDGHAADVIVLALPDESERLVTITYPVPGYRCDATGSVTTTRSPSNRQNGKEWP
jgi:hypothetical protein